MRRQLLVIFITAAMVFLADWSSKYLAVHLDVSVIYDSKRTPLEVIPFLCLLSGLFIWLVDQPLCNLGVGIFTGAWLANCSDRFFRGPVVDFISGGKLFPDAVFDLADICLALGVLLMFIGLLIALRHGQVGGRLSLKTKKRWSVSSPVLLVPAIAAAIICLQWTGAHLAPALLGPGHVSYDQRRPLLPLIIIVSIAVIYLCHSIPTRALATSLGLLIGGGMANLGTRLFQGEVPDFISLPLPGTVRVATNFADMAIVFGACLLIMFSLRGHWTAEAQSSRS